MSVSLRDLELALAEHAGGQMTNERRKEIESYLSNIRQNELAWQHCEEWLSSSSFDWLHWFVFTIYEEMANKRWSSIHPEMRQHIVNFLLNLLTTKHTSFAPYALNKLVEVISIIALHTWPAEFPQLMPTIFMLSRNPSTLPLGLNILSTLAEEFSPGTAIGSSRKATVASAVGTSTRKRRVITSARRTELSLIFLSELPPILEVLFSLLDALYESCFVAPVKAHGNSLRAPMSSPVDVHLQASPMTFMPGSSAAGRFGLGLHSPAASPLRSPRPDIKDGVGGTLPSPFGRSLLSGPAAFPPLGPPSPVHPYNNLHVATAGFHEQPVVGSIGTLSSPVHGSMAARMGRDDNLLGLQGFGGDASGSFGGGVGGGRRHSRGMDAEEENNCVLILEILQSIFSWAPLGEGLISQGALETLYRYATLSGSATSNLGHAALDAIAEILRRNLPSQAHAAEDLAVWAAFRLTDLLRGLSGNGWRVDDVDIPRATVADELDDRYRESFTECLSLFVQFQLFRVQGHPAISIPDFLDLLVKFTFGQTSLEGYRLCLEAWTKLLEAFTERKNNDANFNVNSDLTRIMQRYHPALLNLLKGVLGKLSFQGNSVELNDLSDELRPNESQTELDVFVEESFDVITKLAEFYPEDIYNFVIQPLVQLCSTYLQTHTLLSPTANFALKENQKYLFVFRDLRTFVRLMGQMSNLFGASGSQSLLAGMLSKFVEMGLYTHQNHVESFIPEISKLIVDIFSTLKSYTFWFSHLLKSPMDAEQCNFVSLYDNIILLAIHYLQSPGGETTTLSAASFLQFFTSTVRTDMFLKLSFVAEFMTRFHADGNRLFRIQRPCLNAPESSSEGNNAAQIVYRAFSNVFLLPLANQKIQEQGWDVRTRFYQEFLSGLTQPLSQLFDNPEFVEKKLYEMEEVRTHIIYGCGVLVCILDVVKSEGTASKNVLHAAIGRLTRQIADASKFFQADFDVLSMLVEFFAKCIESIPGSIGTEFTCEILDNFFRLLNPSHLLSKVSNAKQGAEIISKFLRLLRQYVLGRSEEYLEAVVSFSITMLYPFISNDPNSSLTQIFRVQYYELMSALLVNKGKYFAGRPQVFAQVLQCVAGSFQHTDIESVKLNLSTLEELERKSSLFRQPIFIQQRPLFLNLILGVLLRGTHDLLREELLRMLFVIANVDMNDFYSSFLPMFVSQLPLSDPLKASLLSELVVCRDFPSFSTSMERFVSDYLCFEGRMS